MPPNMFRTKATPTLQQLVTAFVVLVIGVSACGQGGNSDSCPVPGTSGAAGADSGGANDGRDGAPEGGRASSGPTTEVPIGGESGGSLASAGTTTGELPSGSTGGTAAGGSAVAGSGLNALTGGTGGDESGQAGETEAGGGTYGGTVDPRFEGIWQFEYVRTNDSVWYVVGICGGGRALVRSNRLGALEPDQDEPAEGTYAATGPLTVYLEFPTAGTDLEPAKLVLEYLPETDEVLAGEPNWFIAARVTGPGTRASPMYGVSCQ